MLGNLRFRLLLEWAAIAILGTHVVAAASNWRGTASFDNLLFDRLSTLSRPPADQNILIISAWQMAMAAKTSCGAFDQAGRSQAPIDFARYIAQRALK